MKVYNTLSGQKEEFLPQDNALDARAVKMYVCGVTPYSDCHIGHAMSCVIFDVIRRYLQFRGYKVKYVQNVTDIDDKIIDRAGRLGISARELAEKYTACFFDDMKALNIKREETDVYPMATDVIPEMITTIQGLVAKGYAYPAQGSVYFRVRNVADYGKLSHRSLASMMALDARALDARAAESAVVATTGSDGSGVQSKEHPMDFVLWKAAKPGEPSWASPWGQGRPGWHIECSAMSLKYLGNTLDIHGGGQDLIFPHHENEIAQSESFTGIKPFVKYWLHNGLVQLGAEKMSKSLGNLVTIKEVLAKHSADALRIFILSSHYRSPLTYSEEALEAAEKGAERLLRVIRRDDPTGGKGEALDAESYRKQFIEAMDDDFNTPQALAFLFDLARQINQAGDTGLSFLNARSVLSELASNVLGLKLEAFDSFLRMPTPEIEPLVNRFSEARLVLRRVKRFELADEIRVALKEKGIILEDATGETTIIWKHFQKSTNTEIEPFVTLAVKVLPVLIEINQLELANRIRDRLDELGIVLEDTPQGTVWKHKR